jgi:outer membrane protein assembly factor BamE (lipoprotein component of BamABCDE complex)
MKQIHKLKLLAPLAAALVLPACSSESISKVNNAGYVREVEIKEQISIGSSTKDDVLSKLGSPSSQSTFGNETWYYITAKKEGLAFMKPEVVEQHVTRVEFDNGGVVSAIESFDHDDGHDFKIAKRTTPTEGHSLGFFEQILGNIGRFNAPSDKGGGSAPGRKPGG